MLVYMALNSCLSSPVHHEGGESCELGSRLLAISTDVSTAKLLAAIKNVLEMLQRKAEILQQTEEMSRKLEASCVSQMPASFLEVLPIPEDLIPQAIGRQCSNILRASTVGGILSIKLDRSE
ncbi:Fragile X mental retardation syndrome protein 1 [Fasciolopsis buskii]|uniref:Fragile X mental retardation syndrome protein 1 n=1 Tax=Fasciolopsis buskii TaxID=27845 RepID=A0A8E0VNR9_9TREM|nr:Fragile X mental retardation syndrome protein 1 [Fasciolopsis buski]